MTQLRMRIIVKKKKLMENVYKNNKICEKKKPYRFVRHWYVFIGFIVLCSDKLVLIKSDLYLHRTKHVLF